METGDITNQLERRGRFLIQEIEEDVSQTKSANVKKNQYKAERADRALMLNKRPKHASIVMNSKITHLTYDDTFPFHAAFSTFVIEDSTGNWVDFEAVWEKFSKVNCEINSTNMEKIFSYTDIQVEYEDDFFGPYPLQKTKSAEHDMKIIHDKLISTIQTSSIINNNHNDTTSHTKVNSETLKQDIKVTMNTLKSLEINFNDDNFIISPLFSPINDPIRSIFNISNIQNEFKMKNPRTAKPSFHSERKPCINKKTGHSTHMNNIKENTLTVTHNTDFSLNLTKPNRSNDFIIENRKVEFIGQPRVATPCCKCELQLK